MRAVARSNPRDRAYPELTEFGKILTNFSFRGGRRITVSPAARRSKEAQSDLFARVLDRIRALPAVESATLADYLPFSVSAPGLKEGFSIEGRLSAGDAPPYLAQSTIVSAGYFKTLRIPLLRGRGFTAGDSAASPPVAIINEAMARRYWPNENPIGMRIQATGPAKEIVGIVRDAKRIALSRSPEPEMFIPLEQARSLRRMTLALRTGMEPTSLIPAVRREVAAVDRDALLERVDTVEGYLEGTVASPRFRSILFVYYAALALLLSGVGLYGLVAHVVTVRLREIGIRRALGAGAQQVLWLILGQGIATALAGTILGIAGAYWLSRFAEGMLSGVAPTDPASFGAAVVFAFLISVSACYLPARRALRVDPAVVLRCE